MGAVPVLMVPQVPCGALELTLTVLMDVHGNSAPSLYTALLVWKKKENMQNMTN